MPRGWVWLPELALRWKYNWPAVAGLPAGGWLNRLWGRKMSESGTLRPRSLAPGAGDARCLALAWRLYQCRCSGAAVSSSCPLLSNGRFFRAPRQRLSQRARDSFVAPIVSQKAAHNRRVRLGQLLALVEQGWYSVGVPGKAARSAFRRAGLPFGRDCRCRNGANRRRRAKGL